MYASNQKWAATSVMYPLSEESPEIVTLALRLPNLTHELVSINYIRAYYSG